ncbi:MAG: ATP phosphoribosyltransferase regulatory subunit [Ottowia sp.]
MSAWLLPDHIADALPAEARHIEQLRRQLLDTAAAFGYELVIPPLIEHLDSLLTGTGSALTLQTFKLVDQLSGKSLGVRADTTPQVARIDAHLLGRQGAARLCYCGPVLHTRAEGPHASREPLQMGAEIYGSASREADLEIITLALHCLHAVGITQQGPLTLDLGDARIPRALLAALPLPAAARPEVLEALAAKDSSRLAALTAALPQEAQALRQCLLALPGLYGDARVLDEAARLLDALPATDALAAARTALADLRWLAGQIQPLAQATGAADAALPGVRVSFDLADARGYAYYSGMRFAVYAGAQADEAGASDEAARARQRVRMSAALLRGGRYDGVGAVFSAHEQQRERPAVGFSLDVRHLARASCPPPPRPAIRAPWASAAAAPELARAIAALRAQGETVICELPGTPTPAGESRCTLQLVQRQGQWEVAPIAATAPL